MLAGVVILLLKFISCLNNFSMRTFTFKLASLQGKNISLFFYISTALDPSNIVHLTDTVKQWSKVHNLLAFFILIANFMQFYFFIYFLILLLLLSYIDILYFSCSPSLTIHILQIQVKEEMFHFASTCYILVLYHLLVFEKRFILP